MAYQPYQQPPHGAAPDYYQQSSHQPYAQPPHPPYAQSPSQEAWTSEYEQTPPQKHPQSPAPQYQQTPPQEYYQPTPPQPQNQGQMPYPPEQFVQSPPLYGNEPEYNKGEKVDFKDVFKIEQPKWNDLWASILFGLFCLGFLIISGFAISGYQHVESHGIHDPNAPLALNTNTIVLFLFVVFVAFLISFVYFLAVRYFTKTIIYITFILQVAMGVGTSIIYFARHYYSAAVIFLLFAIVYIFCFFSWRKRIPFSVLMLETVIDVAQNFGHVFVVSLVGGLVATVFSVYFSITLVGIYAKYSPGEAQCGSDGSCSTGKVVGLIVFITFAAYWITEVIKNVIHVTISGVYGSWYFCSQKPGGVPRGATSGAFKRAMTYSFGSISFGSLVVAIIQFLRQICSVWAAEERSSGNIFGIIISCFVGCFVNFLDWLVEFINEYAFSYIALYGKAYIPAAKDTWRMVRSRGIDALVNECLINPVLTMGSVFVAYVCALIAYLYIELTKPAYNSTGGYTPVVMMVAFLLGLQICNIFLVPIKSGLATFFVAMAFDPEVLEKEFPELYGKMVVVYPKVQECIRPGA